MLAIEQRRQADWFLGKIQIVLGFLLVIVGAIQKVDSNRFSWIAPLSYGISIVQTYGWIYIALSPLAIAAVQAGRRYFGNPWAWEAIQKILDEFRAELFKDREDEPIDHHRVTLFKFRRLHVRLRKPREWHHRLVAVARSEHLNRENIRSFWVPDDGDKCEGVAGRAWRSKKWVVVPKPGKTLQAPTRSSSDTEVLIYAEETGVTISWVREQLKQGRPLASSFAALQVRLKGRPWGVIVVDSRGAVDGAELLRKIEKFEPYASVLTPILERV